MSKFRKVLELLSISNALVMLFLISTIQVSASESNLRNGLSFNEQVESAVNSNDNSSPIPLEWESECIGVATGYGEPKWVQYCYKSELHIDAFSKDDTNIKGTVEFKFYGLASNYFAMCSLSRTVLGSDAIGSYWYSAKAAFTGTYYYAYQSISMNITQRISGSIPQNFSPIKFDGRVNDYLTKIIWQGSVFFNAKYDVPIDEDEEWDSGFMALAEKNLKACAHNNNFGNVKQDFFIGGGDDIYVITGDSGLFDKIKNIAASKGEVDNIIKVIGKKWSGACYGISATMALVFHELLSPKEISGEDVESYYQLKAPKDNIYFRDVIHYYNASQYLNNFTKFHLAEKKWFENKSDFDSLPQDSLPEVLSGLVKDTKNAAMSHRVLMLSYGAPYIDDKGEQKFGGHAILVTAYRYKKKEKKYDLTLYDMNKRVFTHMEIPEDCDSFNMDATCGPISLANCTRLCYIDPDKIMQVSHVNSQKNTENYTFICFSSDSSFKLTSGIGLSLTYENNEFSGDLPVFSLDYIDNDIKIKTAYCSSYKIEPISRDIDINIYDNDHFKAVVGNNIESIDVSIPGVMKLNGNIYTFKAYASVEEMLDEKESGMGSIFAKGKGEVVIHPAQNTVEATSKKPMSGIETAVYQGVDVIEGTIKGNQKKIVLKVTEDKDNHNLEEGGMIIFSKQGYAYKGRPIKPFVSVYVGGKSLKKNKEFKVQYEDNVEIGKGKLTVTGAGEYSGTLTAEFPIIPKKVKMKKVVNYESGVQVTWKTNGPRDGFEIQYATDPEFKDAVSKKVEDAESVSTEIGGLVVGTEYFVRIRAYKTVGDEIFNSNWSDIKSILIYPY